MADKPRFEGERVKLRDVCTIVSGATPKTKTGEYWDGEIKWVTPAELDNDSHYISDTEKHLTEAGYKSAGLHMMPKGTVLLTTRAPIGKVAIAAEEMSCNQGFKNLVCSSVVNNEFLYLYLKSRTAELQAMGRGATFKELSKKNVAGFEINLPTIDRQLDAVAKLTAVGNQIARAKQQHDQLDTLVKSRFVEMFGDGCYPWCSLSSLSTTMQNGLSPSKAGVSYARVLTLSALTRGGFDESAWKKGAFKEEPPLDKRVTGGCLYVCRGNGNRDLVGMAEFAPRSMRDLVFPDTMIEVGINQEKVLPAYLAIAWKQRFAREQIERFAKTTNGTYKINQKALGAIEIPIPPLALQQQFADFVAQVDKSRFVVLNGKISRIQLISRRIAHRYSR